MIAAVLPDALTARSTAALASLRDQGFAVSTLTAAECAAVIGRRFRTRALTRAEAAEAFMSVDDWIAGFVDAPAATGEADIADASVFLRRLDLALRTADAIHLAIVRRLSATLLTFDAALADAARALDVRVATA